MAQTIRKRRKSYKTSTKKSSKKTGRKSTTTTPSSYGYGVKSQTNVRTRSKRKRNTTIKPYSSNYEYTIAQHLLSEGVKFEYEPTRVDYRVPIRKGYCEKCGSNTVSKLASYTPDFFIPSTGLWIETKGKWDSEGRTKIIAILESSDTINRDNFRMLFMYDNWITKNHKSTYMQWCEQHDIIAAVGKTVPLEWCK